MKRWQETTALTLLGGLLFLVGPVSESRAATCAPTEPDMLGPYYKPNAPARSTVGTGYVLTGVVRSSEGCSPIPGAVLEFWLAGPEGVYDDAHRATATADRTGAYRFELICPRIPPARRTASGGGQADRFGLLLGCSLVPCCSTYLLIVSSVTAPTLPT